MIPRLARLARSLGMTGRKPKPLPKNALPKIRTKIPGPQSLKLTAELKRFECPQLTFISESFPVFLKKAQGANFIDVDRNRYLDLTSCFGVMGVGHGSPAVREAMKRQAAEMMHGLGDVHPNEVKVLLAKRLSEITPGNLNQSFFSSTGAEAVETALKTAVMHTKKTGVIAFEGAYHGLNYGALNVTHRADFRRPFEKQLGKHVFFAPFADIKAVQKLVKQARRSPHQVGAIIIEPIQGRGGIRVAPPDFLKSLRAFCDEEAIVLIADEVFTGFGRTGSMFAVEKSGVVPDLMCLGKGMGAGFPISVCVGSTRVMHSWGPSTGDAIHTSTFVGHPLGSAVALAVIKEIEERRFVDRSKALGDFFRKELWKLKEKHSLIGDVRGGGLMIGVELVEGKAPATLKTRAFIQECLRQGIVLLSAGENHNVLSITPPFVISEKEITFCVQQFEKILKKIA